MLTLAKFAALIHSCIAGSATIGRNCALGGAATDVLSKSGAFSGPLAQVPGGGATVIDDAALVAWRAGRARPGGGLGAVHPLHPLRRDARAEQQPHHQKDTEAGDAARQRRHRVHIRQVCQSRQFERILGMDVAYRALAAGGSVRRTDGAGGTGIEAC